MSSPIKSSANRVRLSPAQIRAVLGQLLEGQAITRKQAEGAARVVSCLGDAHDAALSDVLHELFADKPEGGALSAFRGLKKQIADAAASMNLALELVVDGSRKAATSDRRCWFAGEDTASAQVAALQRGLLDQGEYRPEAFTPLRARSTRPLIFVSSSDRGKTTERKLIDAFLADVKTQLASLGRRDVAQALWHFRDHQDHNMTEVIKRALDDCQIGLLLLSAEYTASDFIREHELPRFQPAAHADGNAGAKDCVAVLLSTVCAGDSPVEINRRLHTDDGRGGLQVLRHEPKALSFAGCSPQQRKAFADVVARALIAKIGERSRTEPDGTAKSRALARRQRADLEADERYRGGEYVTPNARPADLRRDAQQAPKFAEEMPSGSSEASFDALEHLLEWVRAKEGPRLHALLGDLGSGKTFTCRMLARALLDAVDKTPQEPLPIYIDLREAGLSTNRVSVPTLDEVLGGWLRSWQLGASPDHGLAPDDIKRLVLEGAIVIFDGFDEVAVHLARNDDHLFLRELWRIVVAPEGQAMRGKALISCRSHYFPSLSAQNALLVDEARGGPPGRGQKTPGTEEVQAPGCDGTTLLPFDDAQVQAYLERALGAGEARRAMEVISTVHDLRELSAQPYLLRLIRIHIPALEVQSAQGAIINAAALYELFIQDWLQRDEGKHVIDRPDKLLLMEHLALQLWREGQRQWPFERLHEWVHAELGARPAWTFRYQSDAQLVAKDLHTATFVVRDASDGFRFAHTSIQEFFVAKALWRALVESRPDEWSLAGVSDETLAFVADLWKVAGPDGQRRAVAALHRIHAVPPSREAAALAFSYLNQALGKGWPVTLPAVLDLSGLSLRGVQMHGTEGTPWRMERLVLRQALLNEGRFAHLRIVRLDAGGSKLSGSWWENCHIESADFEKADLAGAQWRKGLVRKARFAGARLWRTAFRSMDLVDAEGIDKAVEAAPWAIGSTPVPRQGVGQRDSHSLNPISVSGGRLGVVNSCAVSPDGRWLVSGGDDRTVRVWDAASGECLRVLTGHEGGVQACAVSPDGRWLVSGGDDRTVRVWDAASGECLRVLTGHERGVQACAVSPDGRWLVSGGTDGTVRVWDAASGECLRVLTGHEDWVRACAVSPDGRWLVSGGDDRTVRVWDAASGECLRVLTGHEDRVLACAVSPDGRWLVSGGDDRTVRVWDAASGECLRVLTGHERGVQACAVSPDGRWLVSGGTDGTVRVWDAASGECLRVLTGQEGWVQACAVSPDGRWLVSGGRDRTVRVWDAASGECLRVLTGHDGGVQACAVSPDGRWLVSGGADGTARVWDAASGECLRVLTGHDGGVQACAVSPDGRWLVSGGADRTVRVWDAASGECLRVLTGQEGWVQACAVSPDGRWLVSGGTDGTVRVWDAASGECLRVLTGHERGVQACAVSPDGRWLVSGGRDRTVRVWDAASGECLRVLTGHERGVQACAVSPDGRWLVSGGADGTARVWDAASGECLRVLTGHDGGVQACAVSPDGRWLVSGGDDRTVRVWDAASGECLRVLTGHEGWLQACAVSPDGRWLVSGGRDGTVRVWDAASGECLRVLTGHEDWVLACAVSPDGRWLVSGGRDGTVQVWDAASGERQWAGRHLPGRASTVEDSFGIRSATDSAWPYLGVFGFDVQTSRPIWVPVEPSEVPGWHARVMQQRSRMAQAWIG